MGNSNHLNNEVLEHIVQKLNYPYQVLPDNLTLEQAVEIYEEALERGRKEGFTPVLIPEDNVLEEYLGIMQDEEYSVEETLKQMNESGKDILHQLLKDEENPSNGLGGVSIDAILGELEGGEELNVFISLLKYGEDHLQKTVLVEVPTTNPWEVPVYVPFGGWNDCPEPDKMAAICRYWYEQHGAIPAVITHDTLEMLVPQPVAKEQAMELAKEHYVFCIDRVSQCTRSGSIGEVADALWQSRVWYFWWD